MEIEIIPERIRYYNSENTARPKRRVAAYARVSTELDEQQSSYEAQINYYTRYIHEREDWEFVDIYADEGITGTNTKNRDGFKRMVADAMDGKIDLIITKSISRFARNTVDTLNTVRQLKSKNVEVFFEKENIHTLDSKGELFITIMSSLAQEESRSISENVTWSKQKGMEEGKVYLPYKRFLGYEKGPDGRPQIVEEEAKIIRLIYALFLEGKSIRYIANHLTKKNIKTPSGKSNWSVSTVLSILQNEKYKGEAILQKTYVADFLTKEIVKNTGGRKQYYVKKSHPAIISPETFAIVQEELRKRTSGKRGQSSNLFSAKIICGECSGYYGSKVWHSGSKHKTHIWQCNDKYKNDIVCRTPHVTDEQIKHGFIIALNRYLKDKNQYIATYEKEILPVIDNIKQLKDSILHLEMEISETEQKMSSLIDDLSRHAISEKDYYTNYYTLDEKLNLLIITKETSEKQITNEANRQKKITDILATLAETDEFITDFDAALWTSLITSVIVQSDRTLTFNFKDGVKFSVPI